MLVYSVLCTSVFMIMDYVCVYVCAGCVCMCVLQGNGVYLVATSILPPTHKVPARLQENLQRHALRALRYSGKGCGKRGK